MVVMAENSRKWLLYGAYVGLASILLLFLPAIGLPAGFGRLLDGGWSGILALLFLIPVVLSVPASRGGAQYFIWSILSG